MLTIICIFILIGYAVILCLSRKRKRIREIFNTINILLAMASLYGILGFTVFGRTASKEYTFIFFAPYTNEFYREMFMNALLYFPLGLTLTVLIGPWSILVAFLLSISIESWQYFAGTGLAQGTDVIMNTLGVAIGSLPYIIVKIMNRRHNPR